LNMHTTRCSRDRRKEGGGEAGLYPPPKKGKESPPKRTGKSDRCSHWERKNAGTESFNGIKGGGGFFLKKKKSLYFLKKKEDRNACPKKRIAVGKGDPDCELLRTGDRSPGKRRYKKEKWLSPQRVDPSPDPSLEIKSKDTAKEREEKKRGGVVLYKGKKESDVAEGGKKEDNNPPGCANQGGDIKTKPKFGWKRVFRFVRIKVIPQTGLRRDGRSFLCLEKYINLDVINKNCQESTGESEGTPWLKKKGQNFLKRLMGGKELSETRRQGYGIGEPRRGRTLYQ